VGCVEVTSQSKLSQKIIYYCDESHIRGSKWFGVGGLAIPLDQLPFVEGAIYALRASQGYDGQDNQIQYKTAKKRRDNIYRAYIDLLAALIKDKHVHLHLRFKYAHGERVDTSSISKAFYSLLLHRAGRQFGSSAKLIIRPDNGCCTEYLPQIKSGLNADILRRRYSGNSTAVIDISPCDSAFHHPLQLLDVTLGAISSARNGYHLDGSTGEFKSELTKYALKKLGLTDEIYDTPINSAHLNIWNVR